MISYLPSSDCIFLRVSAPLRAILLLALSTFAAHADTPPFTVLDKTATPPSGDKHDYLTLSPYYWPDPDTPDGLPYVFRDGEVNPEAAGDQYDRVRYFKMADAVVDAAGRWKESGEAQHATRAVAQIRAWFLNPATRMNPNFNYAQFVPGKSEGDPTGIIRGIRLLDIDAAITELRGSEHWSEADDTAWHAWLSAYLDWLLESPLGQKEAKSFNNHGTWYDVQVATFALATGREAVARAVLEEVGPRRIARQIKEDGRQRFELMRTKSWDYSVMNLDAHFRLAAIGERLGVDLWHFESRTGAGLRKALDYLLPFALGEEAWPGKQIRDFHPEALLPLLKQAAAVYDEPRYTAAMAALTPGE